MILDLTTLRYSKSHLIFFIKGTKSCILVLNQPLFNCLNVLKHIWKSGIVSEIFSLYLIIAGQHLINFCQGINIWSTEAWITWYRIAFCIRLVSTPFSSKSHHFHCSHMTLHDPDSPCIAKSKSIVFPTGKAQIQWGHIGLVQCSYTRRNAEQSESDSFSPCLQRDWSGFTPWKLIEVTTDCLGVM